MVKTIATLLVSLVITSGAGLQLHLRRPTTSIPKLYEEGLIYLPDTKMVKKLSLGYSTTLANYFWFQTNNYFGRHYRSDRAYDWLGHMCNLIHILDPRKTHVVEFCSLMLAWEANDPASGQALLSDGITATPTHWRYYVIRGLHARIFFGDNQQARDDFVKGAEQPDAPVYVTRLASKALANVSTPVDAVTFLKQMIASTEDETQKEVLTRHLVRTIHTLNIATLEAACKQMTKISGSKPTTLNECKPSVTHDPMGKPYYLTSKGKVRSKSKIKRIKLFAEHFSQGEARYEQNPSALH